MNLPEEGIELAPGHHLSNKKSRGSRFKSLNSLNSCLRLKSIQYEKINGSNASNVASFWLLYASNWRRIRDGFFSWEGFHSDYDAIVLPRDFQQRH